MSFSSSPLPLQPSTSQLPLRPFPLLPFLPSELYTQPNITSSLPQVEVGAAAAPHASAASLATAFQGSWHCFVKYQSGRGKI